MKVYIHGFEGNGWSIDNDKKYIMESIKECGIKTTRTPFLAKYIHSLWWNNFINKKLYLLHFFSNIFLTCSNFIDPDDKNFRLHHEFSIARKTTDLWITPSTKQKDILDKLGLATFYMPFFIDYEMFSHKTRLNPKEICTKYNIPFELLEGKIIIGSFQRDSLGTNLFIPKWQKNPDGLIEILRHSDKSKYILLLAGPRRHYIRKKCKQYNIPFVFVGRETSNDDMNVNILGSQEIKELYSLIDIVLCTSVMEGGPKCILESAASGVLCLSTDVGLASDILPAECISDSIYQLGKTFDLFINNKEYFKKYISFSQNKCYKLINKEARKKYIQSLYLNDPLRR